MRLFQNFPGPEQLNLDFENLSPQPVIWQWNELSPHVRAVILEWATCTNPKTNKAKR
jgi:hypothetical protein